MIDQAAVDFAFLNSKAARKRLVKVRFNNLCKHDSFILIMSLQFMSQIPKSRTDLLPHYSRFIAILNRYMPDVGSEIVAMVSSRFIRLLS